MFTWHQHFSRGPTRLLTQINNCIDQQQQACQVSAKQSRWSPSRGSHSKCCTALDEFHSVCFRFDAHYCSQATQLGAKLQCWRLVGANLCDICLRRNISWVFVQSKWPWLVGTVRLTVRQTSITLLLRLANVIRRTRDFWFAHFKLVIFHYKS